MEEWRRCSIGSFGLVVTGATPRTGDEESWGQGIPFITPSEIGYSLREPTPGRRLSLQGQKNMAGKVIPANSVLFVCIGFSTGKVSFVRESVITNQQVNSVIPDPVIVDPLFVYYLLRFYAPRIRQMASGSTTPIVNKAQFQEFEVVVPGRGDQQAIAEVLGVLDDKIALNEQIRETSLSLASAHYEAVSTGGEPELIGDLAVLFDGPHATPKKTETGPWFLSISSLKNGYLDLGESAHLSEEDFPRWTRRVQPEAGDVLFSYETRLGDAALMPPGVRGSLGRRMALLRSKTKSVSGALLLHAYLSPAFQEEIKRRTVHGATVDRLPLKEMPGWRIPLPAQGERERLSARLEALHATVTQTANENRTLADLRDTLLPQLLSGKLRVKDAVRAVEEVV
ncbi:restriction endonuclease subunit S [Streptomyces violaceus]|uniref:restriction endonuclease subunit S n=1 Tax=Streptomyces violaceus TaxID=1936 RepID=UPI002E24704E|nr:restriction endonuclease subunit S [Streptomyces violaceus]